MVLSLRQAASLPNQSLSPEPRPDGLPPTHHLICSGRGPGYPGLPAQIPACGFPAPGSCRRSNAIEAPRRRRPVQLRSAGSQLLGHAKPGPVSGHAALLTFPSTGRLPSTISAADMSRHCSRLHRYYAAVRLLASSPAASSPRLPDVTRVRRSGCGRGEVSQVPTRSFPA